MRFGICCGLGSFPRRNPDDPLSSIPALMETLVDARADYLEFGVATVMPDNGQAEFEALREALDGQPLKVEAFNSFIPARHRITGPEVDLDAVLAYCRTALPRCKAVGAAVVVLGSAGARRVPEGFDCSQARDQFVRFCRELGPIAEEAGVEIVLEPLNRGEDNLLNSVAQGIEIVDEIGHPSIRLLADFYHMFVENESLGNVGAAGPRLRHAHLADLGRLAPGFAARGEADFVGFFRQLRAARYAGRCSFEGSFTDIARQSGPVVSLLRRRYEESV